MAGDKERADMTDLIKRLEAATEADRELDWDIAILFGVKRGPRPEIRRELSQTEFVVGLPRYTASIDAALTLVPDGYYLELKGPRTYLNIPTPVPNYWSAHISSFDYEKSTSGWGSTAPLAICIAALKARKGD